MKYSVFGPRGVVLAAGLTLKQAETYCKNCGGKVAAENPLTRVKINSPRQRPASAPASERKPSKRLIARRKKTAATKTRGVYANPIIEFGKSKGSSNFPFLVQVKNTENWNTSGGFKSKDDAIVAAHALAEKYPRLPVRVYEYTGGPMP